MSEKHWWRNKFWKIAPGHLPNSVAGTAEGQLAVLQDIREELKLLNHRLATSNLTISVGDDNEHR